MKQYIKVELQEYKQLLLLVGQYNLLSYEYQCLLDYVNELQPDEPDIEPKHNTIGFQYKKENEK